MTTSHSFKKKNLKVIINYLRNDVQSGRLDSEACESVEVAIQCLQNAYGITRDYIEEAKKTPSSFFEQLEKYLNNYEESQECQYNASLLAETDQQKKISAEKIKEDGNLAMRKGNYAKGLDLYTKAIQFDSSNAVYYCNRAAAFMKLDDYHSAISDCNTALRINPNYSKAYARLGVAHDALKNYKKAIEYHKKALAMEPTNVSYKNNLKLADIKLSRTQLPPNLPPPFNNPELFAFAQEIFSDPSLNALGRRLAEQYYPDIARQTPGSGTQNLSPPYDRDDKKEG